MSDISFAQFDLLSAMEPTDFVVGYRGNREVRLTYLSLISGISGMNISGTGGGSASGLDVGTLRTFLSTNNIVLSSGTVISDLSVGGKLFTEEFLTYGTGVPTISSATSLNLDAGVRIAILNSPIRLPNISTSTRNSLSPLLGDMIYNSTETEVQIYGDFNTDVDWYSLATSDVQVLSTDSVTVNIDVSNFSTYFNKILHVRSVSPARINFSANLPAGFSLTVINDSTQNVTLTSVTDGIFLSFNNILSGSNGVSKLYNFAKIYKYGNNFYKI